MLTDARGDSRTTAAQTTPSPAAQYGVRSPHHCTTPEMYEFLVLINCGCRSPVDGTVSCCAVVREGERVELKGLWESTMEEGEDAVFPFAVCVLEEQGSEWPKMQRSRRGSDVLKVGKK
jgi:hypothetical protein